MWKEKIDTINCPVTSTCIPIQACIHMHTCRYPHTPILNFKMNKHFFIFFWWFRHYLHSFASSCFKELIFCKQSKKCTHGNSELRKCFLGFAWEAIWIHWGQSFEAGSCFAPGWPQSHCLLCLNLTSAGVTWGVPMLGSLSVPQS